MLYRCAKVVAMLLLVTTALQAQVLTGKVTGVDGNPLPGANVAIPTLSVGSATDASGVYFIEGLPLDSILVRVSFVGFETVERGVRIRPGTNELDVQFETALEVFETIEAVDRRQRDLRISGQSLTTITPEDLEQTRGQTLGETLEAVAGVTTMTTGPSISKPVIRGLHGSRIVVVNKGVAQEGQQWGEEHAPEIDPFAASSIQVLRGPAAVEHGAGAIGGVVKIEPRAMPRSGRGGSLSLSGFSNNRQGAGSLMVEGAVEGVPGLSLRIQGNGRRAGDSSSPEYVLRNTAFGQEEVSVESSFQRGQLNLHGSLSHFHTRLGIFAESHIGNLTDLQRAIDRGRPAQNAAFGYEVGNPSQSVNHSIAAISAEWRGYSGERMEARYGFQRNLREEFDAHGDSERAAFGLRLLSHSIDLKYHHRPRNKFIGVAGVSVLRQGNVNGESGYLIPNFRAYSAGVFARESWVGDRTTVDAGIRADFRYQRAFPEVNRSFVEEINTYNSLSGALAVNYLLSPTWSLSGSIGTAWRPPGINELYSDGVHHGSARFEIGDPDLGPERGLNVDATVRHVSDKATLQVGVFSNRFSDFIHLFPREKPTLTIRGAFPTFEYLQSDAVISGIDGDASLSLTNWFEAGIRGSIVRGRNLEAEQPLFNMPADRVTMLGKVHFPDAGAFDHTYAGLSLRMVARQSHVPEGADYAPAPPAYELLDFDFGTTLTVAGSHFDLVLRGRNLLNRAYRDYLSRFRYFADDPGRTVTLSLRYAFGTSEH